MSLRILKCQICHKEFYSTSFSLSEFRICPRCLKERPEEVEEFKLRQKERKLKKLQEKVETRLMNPSEREDNSFEELLFVIKKEFMMKNNRLPSEDEIAELLKFWLKLAND